MATWRSHTEDKEARDSEQLNKIYNEYKTRDLTIDELRFIYEIDERIMGHRSKTDYEHAMINEIKRSRNKRQDLAKIFDCQGNQISLSREEALQGNNILCHYGDLRIYEDVLIDKTLPEILVGTLTIRADYLEHVALPRIIRDSLLFFRTTYLELGLRDIILIYTILPEIIGADLYFDGSISTMGITIPEEVGDGIYLKEYTLDHLIRDSLPISLPNKFGGIALSNGEYTYEELQGIRQRLNAINKTIEELQQEKSLLISGSERVRKRTRT